MTFIRKVILERYKNMRVKITYEEILNRAVDIDVPDSTNYDDLEQMAKMLYQSEFVTLTGSDYAQTQFLVETPSEEYDWTVI